MTPMISVALIEDNRLVREGIAALLNQQPDLRVVAGGADGDAVLQANATPQVILLDLGLENGDSLRVAEKVKRQFPDTNVIVMDLLPVDEDIVEFINAGIAGFITKDATVDELANTIRLVAGGDRVLPPRVPGLFSQIATAAVAQPAVTFDAVRITKREQEVIELIADGLSTKEIAGRLEIATHTVKSHVRNIMEKLMLHTRLQIAAYAHRDGAS